MIRKTDLAYLAGIVDGEGCIHINKRMWDKGRNMYYYCELTITNTNADIINWVHNNFGGYYSKRISNDMKHKDIYKVKISNHTAEKLLIKILPYLIIKQEQAKLAISLEQSKQISTNKLTEKQLSFRENIYQLNKILNVRGKLVPED